MSGLSALRSIRTRHGAARVVLISVRTEPELIGHALALGVLGYVLRSDAGNALLAAVALLETT
jgi:DNA-binding NarL/FixJ family response regulator